MLASRIRRIGLTLIETLVIVAILGILVAILVPAVMAAREASRKARCTNNLKQIGIGLMSYATAAGAFPGPLGVYSPFARILPFIDQMPLYNSVNFEYSRKINTTLLACSVETFLCPSDTGYGIGLGATNYALNGGTCNSGNAPFSDPTSNLRWISFQHVTDGISTTAFGSEWLIGPRSNVRDPVRSVFYTDTPRIISNDYPVFLLTCSQIPYETAELSTIIKGSTWASPGYGLNIYNHALVPGGHTCLNGTLTLWGAWTASSMHPGGVHVVFGDTHVASIKPSISNALWSAIGTMNGGEVVDGLD
jgi:prepilin-type processing-associated H-X9-DG protein